MRLKPGERFAGYTVERQLGAGGMGVVYLARHPRLERLVALKVLNDVFADDEKARARFERETALITALDHPNIVPIYDRNSPEDEVLWISMKFIEGGDAAHLLTASGGRLGGMRAVHMIADAARGLDHAHRHGILHRDIKPANLLVEQEGSERALVTDFGIARSLEDTETGSRVSATVAYAAPERFGSDPVDHRADVYSLGCTLYKLLTGDPPFPRRDEAAVMAAHLHATPPRPTDQRPDLPAALDGVLATVLAKNPADRYPDCITFADAACLVVDPNWKPIVREQMYGTSAAETVMFPPVPAPEVETMIGLPPTVESPRSGAYRNTGAHRPNSAGGQRLQPPGGQRPESLGGTRFEPPGAQRPRPQSGQWPPQGGQRFEQAGGERPRSPDAPVWQPSGPQRGSADPASAGGPDIGGRQRFSRRRLLIGGVAALSVGAAGAVTAAVTLSGNRSESKSSGSSPQSSTGPVELQAGTQVLALTFSPDSKLLLTGGKDNAAQMWEVATGKQVGSPVTGHSNSIRAVAISPDGTLFATGSEDNTARLWELATRQPVGSPLTAHTNVVRSVAFSPDNTLLATGSDDATAQLWTVRSRMPDGTALTAHSGAVRSLAFAPDGVLLATGSADNTVRLWTVRTREPSGSALAGHNSQVRVVAFHPGGTLLASSGDDATIRIWDVRARKAAGDPLSGHAEPVLSLAFTPDGSRLASGSRDGTVRVWDTTTRAPIGNPLTGHTGPVHSLAFSPDGTLLATGSADNTIRFWRNADIH
ncbi:protein kinase [Nocardia sp. NPDC051030]|uniref:WD40 repeat domain-containing serine/threonine protein kinase n=1 Tax=Nocardia sp. NPDC051030 TaxID=3155162 RepID=UPI003421D7E6